jgi:DNA-binding CsgD family transcriptional regulator
MKTSGIIAVVKNSLYKSAIKQIVQEIKILETLEFKENLQECLQGSCSPKYLIIETLAIPEPVKYSLEKLVTKNRECLILVLNSEHFDQSAEPFVHSLIRSTDTDSLVQSKFQTFFSGSLENGPQENTDSTISEREKEVLQLVARGKTNKEISDALFISTHTVITHRKNITSKLGIKTIAGLAVYAVLNGLIDPDEVNR